MKDDPEILALSAEIDAAEEKLSSLKTKLTEMKRQKAGVEIGMIVRTTGHRRVITLGLGEETVTVGTHDGMPAIFYLKAPEPGPVGDLAEGLFSKDHIFAQATVMRFANMDGALAHLDTIARMMANFESLLKDPTP